MAGAGSAGGSGGARGSGGTRGSGGGRGSNPGGTGPAPSGPALLPVALTAILTGGGWVLLRRWLYDNSWTLDIGLGIALAVVIGILAYGLEKRRGRQG